VELAYEAGAQDARQTREAAERFVDTQDVAASGIMDLFKGKKDEPKAKGKGMHSREITAEERKRISEFFPDNNGSQKSSTYSKVMKFFEE
jgi:hypothetical protein